jgi:DNA polymerase sigma
MERFQSFAAVVLFLKAILAQQDLDKPFTGGLGSYRLYVMVAHHVS